MKVKLFYKSYNQTIKDFETEVNDFMATVEVIDVKYAEVTEGNRDNMTATTSLLVLYK
ncbi:TPA: sporulation protein Cse60 [Streptococcus suis]|nr:sporulation protein Cse60 [Streptococcus suis]HEL1684642.1 sporulation protein Cse60 [Streptococcus suis]HEM2557363.1 sporulation protein Cse60 [Streptococcus suis]